jgi:futalosine hydrolase
MEILIVAATSMEIAPLMKLKLPVDILITGVGVPAAIYQLQKKLQNHQYKLVIQAGIAGIFSKELALGDVVIVERDCFADIGIKENGIFSSIFENKLADENLFPYQNGWLVNSNINKEKISVPFVSGVTINTVSDNLTQKKMLTKKYNAQIESMEGAAFHYVCLQEKISFVQMRSISNEVGERDKTKWAMKAAIKNLNKELVKYLNLNKKN